MTYNQLIRTLAEKSRLSMVDVGRVMNLFRQLVPEAVREAPLRLPDLGTFKVQTRKGRNIRNPATKELMVLPATETLGFKASKHAKRLVSR